MRYVCARFCKINFTFKTLHIKYVPKTVIYLIKYKSSRKNSIISIFPYHVYIIKREIRFQMFFYKIRFQIYLVQFYNTKLFYTRTIDSIFFRKFKITFERLSLHLILHLLQQMIISANFPFERILSSHR